MSLKTRTFLEPEFSLVKHHLRLGRPSGLFSSGLGGETRGKETTGAT